MEGTDGRQHFRQARFYYSHKTKQRLFWALSACATDLPPLERLKDSAALFSAAKQTGFISRQSSSRSKAVFSSLDTIQFLVES